MNDKHKNTIKAVLTAFIFSGLAYLLLTGSTSPMKKLVGYRDVIVETRRPLALESKLFKSDLFEAVASIPAAGEAIDSWRSSRDRYSEVMGSFFDWIGWGPWKVTLAFEKDRPPLIAVGAGHLASLGKNLAVSAGFEKVDDIDGLEALGREEVVFVRHHDIWLVGERSAVEEALLNIRSGSPPWWRLSWNLTGNGDAAALISYGALRKLVGVSDEGRHGVAFFKEWLDMDETGAVPFGFEVADDMIEGRAWIPVDDKAPLPRLWKNLEAGDENLDFIHPATVLTARLSIGDTRKLWEEALEVYAERPMASEFLNGMSRELEKELDVSIDDVLRNIHEEVGFVKIRNEHHKNMVLFTEAGMGWEKSLQKLESQIAGGWQAVFEGVVVRFMPRLLAYGVIGNRLVIASRPSVFGVYFNGVNEDSPLADDMRDIAGRVSKSPLIVAGRIGGKETVGTDAAKASGAGKLAGWIAAGVDYRGGVFVTDFVTPARMGKATSPPLKIRLWGWAVTLLRVLGWMLAAFVLGSFFAHALSVNEKKHGIEGRY